MVSEGRMLVVMGVEGKVAKLVKAVVCVWEIACHSSESESYSPLSSIRPRGRDSCFSFIDGVSKMETTYVEVLVETLLFGA